MFGIEKFDELVGMDLDAAVAEVTHTALLVKALPHGVTEFDKLDRIALVDELIKRLENVKARIRVEV